MTISLIHRVTSSLVTRIKQSVSLEFNQRISTTTIRQKKTPIHHCLNGGISRQILKLTPMTNEEFTMWGNTQLTPDLSDTDLQMIWVYRFQSIRLFAVEVGFSQPTVDLEEKVKSLLRKSTVRAAMLIDVKEKPIYKNPFRKQKNVDLYKSGRNNQRVDFEELLYSPSNKSPPFGPVFLYGIQWTGELTASVQVFSKDTNGEPVERTQRIVSAENAPVELKPVAD